MARILVGISGGVDSAIAAYLLKKDGHEVTGAFMRNWDSVANSDINGNPTINDNICPQEADYNDALKVCEQLGIELLRVDFIKEYWDNVFTYFIDEYKKGYTPNPDILCNKYIKFDFFLKFALDQGYDYIATGHYAKVVHTDEGSFLMKAHDQKKDQTYFLSQLNQYQLSKSLFPLADYEKGEIRQIAKELNLVVADKKDSTGICFIGERDFTEFLKNYIPAQPGDVVDYGTKQKIGEHVGVMYYTIGQSKGLALGGHKDFGDNKWYVIGKNVDKKVLYVSNDPEQAYLKSDKVLINDININNDKFIGIKECNAKFRYRQRDYAIKVEFLDDNQAYITPNGEDLPKGITIGQACVLYDSNYCLGGGTINKIYLNDAELTYE